jgi:stress response protein YsnF
MAKAKTLVGLYDTFDAANKVVDTLVKNDFRRHDISLATHNGDGHQADFTYAEKGAVTGVRQGLVTQLTDLGVPEDEAGLYAEGVRRGCSLVVVKSSDAQSDLGLEIMDRYYPLDINDRVDQWRREGWNRFDATAAPYTDAEVNRERQYYGKGATAAKEDETTIPVVEEEVTIGKRQVERGRVHIHTYTEERPVEKSVQLREERVKVDRRPVDRPATEADLSGARDETIEITETAEEPVVSKRARVVEEVTVRKDVDEHTETVRETERRRDVKVEQEGASPATDRHGFETYDADFRKHHASTFANSGMAYADYEPAYRYGYTLSSDPRYRSHKWPKLEAEARQEWEARHGNTWQQFRDAIYYAWNKQHMRS